MKLASIHIRPASTADVEVLAHIHAFCFENFWKADACAALLAMPGAFALLAEVGDDGFGFILCRVAADESEVLTLAVLPAMRGCGVARTLLGAAIVEGRRRGAQRMFLEVEENNGAARRVYESAGFRITGRRRDYYRGKTGKIMDALMMAVEL